ncbi:SMC family ATPase [Pseudomonas fragi]|uniref:AAA family ATPase n=1 Tax=Pseudomonas fragi TaxID=296 RepID=UPI0014729948|nr:SMC family ATPase [Pseudomonas fragi]NNA84690.1 SMC family ATPase [Pseudomonas fragi]NNB37890.1 SMC family ATPase [Pseudomonas fragi]
MKIKKVEIQAFRAYKMKSEGTFDFTNADDIPSNFVAIFAPNGFGKSSFYDAVEWAITNHLERLGGEYNRANYEGAARVTKDAGKGQEILRNKFVDEKVKTQVVVSTTRPVPFARQLGTIRSNGRDLRFGDRGSENDYFRRVILSQDEIDRFLRESKPQERYAKFMESFGGETEIARKELSALILDNKAELQNLDARREAIIVELNEPVDISIFDNFNALAAQLNAAGENIVLADEQFSAQTEHALSASLVSRQHELSVEREANVRSIDALEERLIKVPEVALHSQFIVDQKAISARFEQGLKDAGRYQELLSSHAKSSSDIQSASQSWAEINDIINQSVGFFHSELRLNDIVRGQRVLGEGLTGHAAQMSGLAKTLSDLNQELKEADDRTAFLRNSLDNAGSIYNELASHRARIEVIAQQVAEKDVAARLDVAKLESFQDDLKQMSGYKISSNFILSTVEGGRYLAQDQVERLTKCSVESEAIENHVKSVHATQAALADQMGVHERLISTGLDYLSAWPSNICPLCSSPHEDAEKLRAKVKSQTLLSRLSQENAELLSTTEARRKHLLDEIGSITRLAEEAHVQHLADLRGKIQKLSARLEIIYREKSDLETEKHALEDRANALAQTVWNLSQEELITRAQGEITQLSLQRSGLLTRQTDSSGAIAQLKQDISRIDADLEALTTEASSLRSQASYLLVSQYLIKSGVSSAQLTEHCQSEKRNIEAQLTNAKSAMEDLAAQCNSLQQKMLAEGMWISIAELRSQKEALDLELTRAQSAINAFYESLATFIVVRLGDSLDYVKSLISSELENRRLRTEQLVTTESGFKLLQELIASFKPYIKRLSLQGELTDLEAKLDQRNQVDALLSSERTSVIEQLKTLINNFFYEDLINVIYRKIDPHPSFKKVEFKPDFDSANPGLNIVVSDEDGILISPILYFSAAQSNILTLSVFLASALHAKDDQGNPIDVVMIDDPIQSMDSINILSTIDLLRSICLQFNKQVIISTHDENFFGLLQRKIPAQILGAKFMQLEKFGVVVPVEPFLN